MKKIKTISVRVSEKEIHDIEIIQESFEDYYEKCRKFKPDVEPFTDSDIIRMALRKWANEFLDEKFGNS